ncbi:MAG TPA: SMP-30/gluconolactonase/LRE family protein [Pseudolysinimonas sp.]|jgi:gluconolactonase
MSTDIEVRDPRFHELFGEVSVEVVQDGFEFIEGPVWRADSGTMVFSDIAGDAMYLLDADKKIAPYRKPSNMGNGSTLDRQGRLVTCEHATSRVVRQETDGSLTVLASHFDGRELNAPNDVIVLSDGTVMFSDPTFGREAYFGVERPESQDVRAVYAVDPDDGVVRRVADGFEQPNGLCVSQDESILYVNDTARNHIKAFTLSDGVASDGRIFAEVVGEGAGSPDGMKIDTVGNVFCTGPGGLHVFSSEGESLGVVKTPLGIANFTWGDDDLKTIYLCGASTLFRVRTLVAGPHL